jgi:hypothetical protein
MVISIVIILIVLAWLIFQIKTAPEGHEDKDGFHLGKGK